MELLYGKPVADSILDKVKSSVDALKVIGKRVPALVIVTVGDDPASKVYINNKLKKAEEVGIKAEQKRFSEYIEQVVLEEVVTKLANDTEVDGIIIQLPLPKHLNESALMKLIPANKDVDGFGIENTGKLALGVDGLKPCTPFGIMKLLEFYDIELEGKNVVVVGRSNIVGKPMATMLTQANATVTLCHSKTKELDRITRGADIVICAIGSPKLFTDYHFSYQQTIIDVGIHKVDGKICGDVNLEAIADLERVYGNHELKITPVPKGVGVLTVAMLLHNTLQARLTI